MKFEEYEEGEIIIKQEEFSNNKLYIILTGDVSVVCKKNKS